jgi:CheY-like chemotaxis protein
MNNVAKPEQHVRHVLIIDDDEMLRSIARFGFESVGGYRVSEAESGVAALEIGLLESPDALLLDVMMPLVDGPQTLENLRSSNLFKQTPIIFLTASSREDEVNRLSALSVAGVIRKPFKPLELPHQVAAILGWSSDVGDFQ